MVIFYIKKDMGFRQPYNCPDKIHLLVLQMLLDSLENTNKSDILLATDKDIYLILLIFRQSFLLPAQNFDIIKRMLGKHLI
jgi:hypothetical protein